MLRPLIVYHVKTPNTICISGFCSATIFWRKFGDTADYVSTTYESKLPISTFVDRDVTFVDVSYDEETMASIANVSNSLTVLDHRLQTVESNSCLIVWKHLNPDVEIPYMLRLIAQSTSRTSTVEAGHFVSALTLEEPSFTRWSYLIDSIVVDSEFYQTFIGFGAIAERQYDVGASILVKEAFPISLYGIRGLAVNTNKFYVHRVGLKLSEFSKTFGAVFYLRPDYNVEVSLRSADPDTDVLSIARHYGGGGTTRSSAFSVSIERFASILRSEDVDQYSSIDKAVKSFQYKKSGSVVVAEVEDALLQHMSVLLGSNVADSLDFNVGVSVRHPNTHDRFGAYVAQLLGLPTCLEHVKWFHRLFPYKVRRTVSFDDDTIHEVLRESKLHGRALNLFLVERLLETVKTVDYAELASSTYYLHVDMKLPGTNFIIKHTLEVFK